MSHVPTTTYLYALNPGNLSSCHFHSRTVPTKASTVQVVVIKVFADSIQAVTTGSDGVRALV